MVTSRLPFCKSSVMVLLAYKIYFLALATTGRPNPCYNYSEILPLREPVLTEKKICEKKDEVSEFKG